MLTLLFGWAEKKLSRKKVKLDEITGEGAEEDQVRLSEPLFLPPFPIANLTLPVQDPSSEKASNAGSEAEDGQEESDYDVEDEYDDNDYVQDYFDNGEGDDLDDLGDGGGGGDGGAF